MLALLEAIVRRLSMAFAMTWEILWALCVGFGLSGVVQADTGLAGAMEGHAAMDMSVAGGTFWQRLLSSRSFTAVRNYYVMDWVAIWRDIVVGLLLAEALGAWVP